MARAVPPRAALSLTAQLLAVPLDPDRDQAREWARQELTDPRYADAKPDWTARAVRWFLDQLGKLGLDSGGLAGTGTGAVLAVLVVVLAVLVWRTRARRFRSPTRDGQVFTGRALDAAQHRALADQAATEGRWADAVQERFRAIARTLEERAIADERPGRTAREVTDEAAAVLPDHAVALSAAATLFDQVLYGGAPAGRQDEERLRATDEAVQRARPDSSVLDLATARVPR
ncbi:MAG: DUF4129 domain-containing protein [Angustibacter sp.]